MLILSEEEVRGLLDLDRLVEAVAEAMVSLSTGQASAPPRVAAMVPERDAMLAAMPAFVPGLEMLEAKLVAVFPANVDMGLDSHQAVIAAFDPHTGVPRALLGARAITEARTAAGAALATRLLAREDAGVLAVVGTGVQARAHLRAIPRVRPIRSARVAGRDRAKAARLAEEMAGELGFPVEAADDVEAAMSGADVVCVCTHAAEPVVPKAWVRPGMHLTSVGVNGRGPELDPEILPGAVVAVESREAALAAFPAGAAEFRAAMEAGVFGPDDVAAELGELVQGSRPGRTSPDQVTVYKSVGVAVQDAAAAALVLAAAAERGVGREIEL